MQMAKTSAKLAQLADAGVPFISILTDPTTGGTTASFAMLGDLIVAEPGALIGFAGQRVIKQTIGQDLPQGFQRAEFVQDHGFIDIIIHREEMRETLGRVLGMIWPPAEHPAAPDSRTAGKDEPEAKRGRSVKPLSPSN